jgi:hypothetical protein
MSDEQRIFFRRLSNQVIDRLRENTFSNWPLISPSAKVMISAGWWYTNILDRVLCIHCCAICHQWKESDNAYRIHHLISPSCPYMQSSNKRSLGLAEQTMTVTTQPKTRVLAKPIHHQYMIASRRYDTFDKWPHTDNKLLPSIESLVDAGFYYTGST